MTLNKAIKVLEDDAEICGLEFNDYLGYVGMHRSAFPQGRYYPSPFVLEAFDVWAENRRQEKEEK